MMPNIVVVAVLLVIVIIARTSSGVEAMGYGGSGGASTPQTVRIAFVRKGFIFGERGYKTAFNKKLLELNGNTSMSFHGRYLLGFEWVMLNEFSPTEFFNALCGTILRSRANAIFYMSDLPVVDYRTATEEYLVQIANFLGLPVIAWTGDNSGVIQVGDHCRFVFDVKISHSPFI